jgi:hypothetical protein
MPTVELDDAEWQQVMNLIIAANPLLMKIGSQLRAQQQQPPIAAGKPTNADGKEASHE